MPGISPMAFAHGMRADYGRMTRYGERLLEKLRQARYLEAHSRAGTRVRIVLPEKCRWFSQLGALERGRWGNLPAGALYASPELIEGTFVANASLGEYFGAREGLLLDRPVQLFIEDGRVRRVQTHDNPGLARDIEQMLAFAPNSDRVGLIAVGVNLGLDAPTGEALVDQNLPGLHIAIGDPAAHATGADWSARTSFAACQADSTLLVDGSMLISHGKLTAPTGSGPGVPD
jgi:leucyl aminopeptidase (aminopeptidase T)